MKIIKRFPKGEVVVSMIEFKGKIIIATNSRIFIMVNKTIKPMPIELKP